MLCQVYLTGKKSGPGEEMVGNAAVRENSTCKGPEAGDVCREKTNAAGMEASGMRQAWRAEDQRVHVKVFGVLGGEGLWSCS